MQQSLFQFDDQTLSIEDIASDLGASEASVRNWIKTGYLLVDDRKKITKESFFHFKREIVGSEKLIKRANKQFVSSARTAKGSEPDNPNSVCPSKNYENSLTAAFKNKEGIFYTPDYIADQFFADLPTDRQSLTFLDPCCGTGNFLLAAIRNGFLPQNVYGFDTDSRAIAIAQSRLSPFYGFPSANVKHRDFLRDKNDAEDWPAKFDVVITNPPWGKKLPKIEREALGRRLGAGKSIDTCSLFFFAALECLKHAGYCGFLLPDSFFNVGAFEAARQRALSLKIVTISDFGKAFVGLLTNAVGITVRNNTASEPNEARCRVLRNGAPHFRRQDQFSSNPNAIFNFRCTDEEAKTIDHALSLPHATLKGQAQWGLGIVTGNNARFVKDHPVTGHMPVWKGSDIGHGSLKPPSTYIPEDLSLYQQVAPLKIYNSPEKLIYKFISNRLVFFHDVEQRRILNSANAMIPESHFNFSQEYLCKYLNSRVINWIFRSIFATHKVLRSDLECLPLFLDFMERGVSFCDEDLCRHLGIKEAGNGTFRIA